MRAEMAKYRVDDLIHRAEAERRYRETRAGKAASERSVLRRLGSSLSRALRRRPTKVLDAPSPVAPAAAIPGTQPSGSA